MKLAGRIASRIVIEPLDDERWASIERRVVSGAAEAGAGRAMLPARSIGRWLAVACVAAAGCVGWLLHAPSSAPVVETAPMHVAMAAERSLIDIGDARIEADPSSVYAVSRPAGGVLVELARGRVALEVGKRGERPPLIVRAGDTDVVVVGTRFSVDYGDGHGAVAVQVSEGVVRVVHQQRETRVAAGQGWQTASGLIAASSSSESRVADAASSESSAGSASAETSGRDAVTASGASGTSSAATASGAPVASSIPAAAGAPSKTSGAEAWHGHHAMVPSSESAQGDAANAPAKQRVSSVRPQTTRRAQAARPDPVADLRGQIRAQRVEPALALDDATGAAAVAKYYEIAAHHSGDEASQAFYSIAVVRHEKLGQDGEALEALDAYVRRFPGGKEYRAALWLRVRILCLDKLDDRCRAAAYTYLHEAPDGPAARVAELITLAE